MDFLNNLIQLVKDRLSSAMILARLYKQHPTCRFYSGAVVDDESILGKYNVIFANTSVTHSTIGDHTFIQRNSFINCAEIGKFCSIAMNVYVGPSQHPTNFVSSHPAFNVYNIYNQVIFLTIGTT